MNLFQKRNIHFHLHSGKESDFKIECDSLTDEDIECIAYLVSKKISFRKVRGIPNGGLRLQKALEKYCNSISETLLIVDDVLTTGNSMKEMLINGDEEDIGETVRGFVIFARGECPGWVESLFQMNNLFY